MTIEFRKNLALFHDVVTVEEAEPLLEWLQRKPAGRVDLSACTHLHAANLQVLMAARANVKVWPKDTSFADWLREALTEPN
jgi:hypothetical protein